MSVFIAFAVLSAALSGAASEAGETLSGRGAATVYDGAILYSIDQNVLEFNVVHSGDISGAQINDGTASGIATADNLKEILGTPDAPNATTHGTDVGARTLGKAVTADLTVDARGNILSLTVTDVRDRPVVGISWKSATIASDYKGFAEALERNGAFAVFLPQVTDAMGAQAVLAKIDGLMETGGSDWNPALYNESQTPHGSSGWNDTRDTSDLHMMQQAIALDVPLLALCRGEQGLNVAMGGGLIQDVPYYLGMKVANGEIDSNRVTGTITDNGYREWIPASEDFTAIRSCDVLHSRVYVDDLIHSGGTAYHNLDAGENIGIDTNSKWLYDIVGYTSLEWVATAHHQAVNPEKLGTGLTIVAYSSDGIVEAIEHQASRFALGVQWHPERDALGDTRAVDVNQDECNAFLRALVKYAGGNENTSVTATASTSGGCSSLGFGGAALFAMACALVALGRRYRA